MKNVISNYPQREMFNSKNYFLFCNAVSITSTVYILSCNSSLFF